MADCFTLRLDHLDFNPSGNIHSEGKPIPISSISKVLFTYDAYLNNANSQQGIFCRLFDTSARTLGSAVAIDNTPTDIAAGANVRFRYPSIVRLTDGTLVCLYRWDTANSTIRWYAKESTDNGATWSARVLVMDETLALARGIDTAGLFANGTTVWANGTGASTLHGFVYLTKRTGIGTWGTPGQLFDITSPSNEAGLNNPWVFNRADHGVLSSDGLTACMIGKKVYDSGTHTDTRALWTTDGTTWTQVVIAAYSVLGPTTFTDYTIDLGTDNRLRVVSLGSDNQIYLSYSDDYGQTWSTPHVPSGSGAGWVRGVASGLDAANKTYAATVGDGGGGGPAHYYAGTDLGAWTNVANCDIGSLDPTYVSYPGNDAGVFSGADFYFVSNGISGGTFHTLQLLLRASVGTTPSAEPSPPTPSVTTAANTDNQLYLRRNRALKLGWSMHDVNVPCFLAWHGGTYMTPVNAPMILIGNPALYETFEGNAGALAFRLDDPNVYNALYFESSSLPPSYDPLPFTVWSRIFTIGAAYEKQIARGFVIRLKRQTAPVTVQVFVDGVAAHTEVLSAKGNRVADYYVGINTADNAGSDFQLRIDDLEQEPLEIHGIGFQTIAKGIRG